MGHGGAQAGRPPPVLTAGSIPPSCAPVSAFFLIVFLEGSATLAFGARHLPEGRALFHHVLQRYHGIGNRLRVPL